MLPLVALITGVVLSGSACASRSLTASEAARERAIRHDALTRAQVWTATDVSRMDIRRGPVEFAKAAGAALAGMSYQSTNSDASLHCVVQRRHQRLDIKSEDDDINGLRGAGDGSQQWARTVLRLSNEFHCNAPWKGARALSCFVRAVAEVDIWPPR